MSDQSPSFDNTQFVGGGGGGGIASINGDTSPAQTLAIVGAAGLHVANPGAGVHNLTLDIFSGAGVPGSVPDPLLVPATDYLAADGTWQPIPSGGGGIASINGDTTSAQTLVNGGGQPFTIRSEERRVGKEC